MDYGTIKARVKMYLDRDDLDTYITYWVNDVRQQIAVTPEIDWPHLWKTHSFTTTAGSSTYAFPSNILDIQYLMLGSKKLMGIDLVDYSQQVLDDEDDPQDQDEPVYFCVTGASMLLQPPPDAAYNCVLYYYAIPASMSTDSSTDYFITNYPMLVVHEACILGATFLDDEVKLNLHTTLAKREWERALKREKKRTLRDITPVFRTYKDYATDVVKNRFRAA